jgi:hypothetical protein
VTICSRGRRPTVVLIGFGEQPISGAEIDAAPLRAAVASATH